MHQRTMGCSYEKHMKKIKFCVRACPCTWRCVLVTINPNFKMLVFQQFFKHLPSLPFKSRVRHFSCRTLQSHNSLGDWARELIKPSTVSASLVVEIDKTNFRFWWGFSEGDVTRRTCFRKVGHLRPALGPNLLIHSFGSKFCLKLGENSRL